MIFGLSLRSLWRWYVIVPGVVLAAALAVGAFFAVPPTYQRNATLLLVPGAGTVPDDGNPYFYLAGLTQAADVVVRAVSSENVQRDIADQYPGVDYQVTRDPTTAGPVISVVGDGPDDGSAEAVAAVLVERAADDLERLQVEDNILPSYRIQLRTVAVDDHSILRERSRLVAAAGVGALGLGAVALLAVILAVRASRSESGETPEVDAPEPGESEIVEAEEQAGWGWDSDEAVDFSAGSMLAANTRSSAEPDPIEQPAEQADADGVEASETAEAEVSLGADNLERHQADQTDVRQTV